MAVVHSGSTRRRNSENSRKHRQCYLQAHDEVLADVAFRADVLHLLEFDALCLQGLQCGARAVFILLDVIFEVVRARTRCLAILPGAFVAEPYMGLLMAP